MSHVLPRPAGRPYRGSMVLPLALGICLVLLTVTFVSVRLVMAFTLGGSPAPEPAWVVTPVPSGPAGAAG